MTFTTFLLKWFFIGIFLLLLLLLQKRPLEALELIPLQASSSYFYVYPHWEDYNTGNYVQKN